MGCTCRTDHGRAAASTEGCRSRFPWVATRPASRLTCRGSRRRGAVAAAPRLRSRAGQRRVTAVDGAPGSWGAGFVERAASSPRSGYPIRTGANRVVQLLRRARGERRDLARRSVSDEGHRALCGHSRSRKATAKTEKFYRPHRRALVPCSTPPHGESERAEGRVARPNPRRGGSPTLARTPSRRGAWPSESTHPRQPRSQPAKTASRLSELGPGPPSETRTSQLARRCFRAQIVGGAR